MIVFLIESVDDSVYTSFLLLPHLDAAAIEAIEATDGAQVEEVSRDKDDEKEECSKEVLHRGYFSHYVDMIILNVRSI